MDVKERDRGRSGSGSSSLVQSSVDPLLVFPLRSSGGGTHSANIASKSRCSSRGANSRTSISSSASPSPQSTQLHVFHTARQR